LIVRNENGLWCITGQLIKPGPDISDGGKKRYRAECTKLARRAIETGYPKNCNVITLTLGMSRRTYEYIIDETDKFKKRVLELTTNDNESDRVYQYQLISFPLTKDESTPGPLTTVCGKPGRDNGVPGA